MSSALMHTTLSDLFIVTLQAEQPHLLTRLGIGHAVASPLSMRLQLLAAMVRVPRPDEQTLFTPLSIHTVPPWAIQNRRRTVRRQTSSRRPAPPPRSFLQVVVSINPEIFLPVMVNLHREVQRPVAALVLMSEPPARPARPDCPQIPAVIDR